MRDFIRDIERVQILNKLIASRRTGRPDELAERIGVSRRQLYLIIEYLKDMGLVISYSRKINSFYYEENSGLLIDFKFKVLSSEEVGKIDGGKIKALVSPNHSFRYNGCLLDHRW